MTNFERIKAFTLPELVAFLVKVLAAGDEYINDKACAHCRKTFGNCPYGETEEPETCRLLERSTTIEYWLNMSPDES